MFLAKLGFNVIKPFSKDLASLLAYLDKVSGVASISYGRLILTEINIAAYIVCVKMY